MIYREILRKWTPLKKIHLVNMSSLSIFFKAQSKVSHPPPLKNEHVLITPSFQDLFPRKVHRTHYQPRLWECSDALVTPRAHQTASDYLSNQHNSFQRTLASHVGLAFKKHAWGVPRREAPQCDQKTPQRLKGNAVQRRGWGVRLMRLPYVTFYFCFFLLVSGIKIFIFAWFTLLPLKK